MMTRIVQFFLAFLVLNTALPAFAADGKEGAYDRVMRTQTLRCGYFTWRPYMYKNYETGAFEGFYYDYVEALGKHLGIKIDWAAEVLYGQVPQEIGSGKIDAFCSGIWPTAGLALLLDFTKPTSYNAVLAVVRADDTRFDGDLSRIDSKDIKIVSMEGTIAGVIQKLRFPKAALVETPAVSGPSAQLMEIFTKKADVTFVDWLLVRDFMKNNPGSLKVVEGVEPVNIWGNTLAFGKHEEPLVNAINTVTEQMLYSGEIDAILKKYEAFTKDFYKADLPYETSQ